MPLTNINQKYDVLLLGADAVGCAIARELARYRLRIGVLEKEPDVGLGTRKYGRVGENTMCWINASTVRFGR